jgi:hypothetical protein
MRKHLLYEDYGSANKWIQAQVSASTEHRGQTRTGLVRYVSNYTVVPPPLLQLLPPLRPNMQPACTPVWLAEVCTSVYRLCQYRPLHRLLLPTKREKEME